MHFSAVVLFSRVHVGGRGGPVCMPRAKRPSPGSNVDSSNGASSAANRLSPTGGVA